MKAYTYSEARKKFPEVLDVARFEEVMIKRRSGESFVVKYKSLPKSPFDVPGIRTKASTQDILDAIRQSRSRSQQ
ncbi:Antitoxin [Candidatus Desulfarcum epimagneticum]|uniref:Antitoxin n=1 Tax=uncultured Desulfobacteraceae bacterium TaxID=218296 RepID=A0A484HEI7_9BACT|nr:Antitoxin [uncultured Desulfobacteraceae bacterium]